MANSNEWSGREKICPQNDTSEPEINAEIHGVKWSDCHDKHLSYIGHECTTIPNVLSTSYGDLARRLDLSYNRISKLDGLERFKVLEELVLDNNNLDDDATFPVNHKLKTLSINKNELKNLERLIQKLKNCFPNLTYLSLLGNEACPNQLMNSENDDDDYQRYRYFVIHKLSGLKFLDSTPVRSKERLEAERVGAYTNIARPTEKTLNERSFTADIQNNATYTPLPPECPVEGAHRGAFGTRRHIYSGKHSEGNRFIRNTDL